MRSHDVYGTRDMNSGFGEFVNIHLFEDGMLSIYWSSNRHAISYFFKMKDMDDYDDFRNEIVSVLSECNDINEAYYELENYLGSDEIDDFLEEYHEF